MKLGTTPGKPRGTGGSVTVPPETETATPSAPTPRIVAAAMADLTHPMQSAADGAGR
jgi:hypothetical protein